MRVLLWSCSHWFGHFICFWVQGQHFSMSTFSIISGQKVKSAIYKSTFAQCCELCTACTLKQTGDLPILSGLLSSEHWSTAQEDNNGTDNFFFANNIKWRKLFSKVLFFSPSKFQFLLLALSSGDSQPFGRSTAVKAKRKRRFTYTNINVRQQQKHTKRVILCILLFSTKSTKLDFVCSSFKEVQIQKMSNFSIYL